LIHFYKRSLASMNGLECMNHVSDLSGSDKVNISFLSHR